jgi:tellurite resistance protein
MSHFPPPPPVPPRVGLFRRVPPAIFPALFGLLGLALAWRRGVEAFGLNGALVELGVGAVSFVFGVGCMAYAVKAALRISAVAEDWRTLPGRTGLAALALGLMAEAALLVPYAPGLARLLLAAGVSGLAVISVAVLIARLRGVDPAGPITPAAHLVFVGFIVAPLAAVPLGLWPEAMVWVVRYSALAALAVAALTILPLVRGVAPPPLRPLQAIHLAPPSLIATGAYLTGQPMLALGALFAATLIAGALLLRARWMTVAGFSGFWSAFTFPVTAYAGALLMAAGMDRVSSARMAGGIVLVAATLYVPVIAYRVLKLWAGGGLAAKTNASTA